MSEKVEATFAIVNALGLHARAAIKLTQTAQRYASEVMLSCEGQEANGKSVMGVLLLCGAKGMQLRVQAIGTDAAKAVEAIGRLIADRFDESQ